MIVKMKRLTLLAMDSDKQAILDALVRSNAVQLKRSEDISACTSPSTSLACEKIGERIARAEEAIAYLSQQAEQFNATHKESKVKLPKNSFARPLTEIDYDYFLGFGNHVEDTERDIAQIALLRSNAEQIKAQLAQKQNQIDTYRQYQNLPHPTTWYADTQTAFVRLCQLPTSELPNIKALVSDYDAVAIDVVDDSANFALVAVVAHKSQGEFFEKATVHGLVKVNFVCDVLPKLALVDLLRQKDGLTKQLGEVNQQIVSYASKLGEYKIYIDYLGLCNKKLVAEGDMQQTDRTFVLEGFYPEEQETKVTQAIAKVGDCIVLTLHEIGEEEFAPTLVKSSKLVKPFEFITNMYTPPAYHEIDPNPVMSIFYFLIFGFMVADIGYGLLLLLAGVFATFAIKQKTAIRTMLQLFAICGVGAILVGALFGSFFSYQIMPGVIPNPAEYPMVMMFISLILGIVHLMAGIGCNMAVKIKHKKIASAWLVDFPWIVVFISFIGAVLNLMLDMAAYPPYDVLRLSPLASNVCLYVCLGSLAFALIFAGFDSKGLIGKVVKSFGSAYGLINYFSDIMSYIRIFGLMLSSALMGTVINQLGGMVSTGGGIGYLFAAMILVFAHLFNLVMGILGVYIHDGRLQYVEFFGKFYTGDGMLFVPFGNDNKYTLVKEAE